MEPFELTDGVVLLSIPVEADVDRLTALCQDPEILRWTAALPSPYLREHAEAFVNEFVPRGWAEDRLAWAVRDPASATLHGVVSVDLADDGEVGFWMGADSRGRGWTTRAVRLVAAAAFERGADHLRWRARVGNEASRRVAVKAGFRFDGTIRRFLVQRGVRKDGWVATMLPDELLR